MPNVNDSSDFANFLQLYKQYVDSRSPGNPQPLAGPQLPLSQVQRSPQHLSPTHPRPQPTRQPPFRNPADSSTFLRALDDIKKRDEEIYVAIIALQTMADQIKKTVDEGVARMVGTMERFEHIGRGVLEMAVQPSNSQPPNSASSQLHASNPPQPSQYASQPPTSSNPRGTYSGTSATQLPHTQHLYAPQASQAQESFSEPYMEYSSGFDFMVNDPS